MGAALPLLLDCDPGVDDAAALLLALASPELELRAVSTVSGNLPLTVTGANARRVLDAAGRDDLAVHAGCARPWLRPPLHAAHVHGADGLGDDSGLPLPSRPPDGLLAPAEIARHALDGVTLAAIGPLTNVATALLFEPRLPSLLPRLLVMGGALQGGNVTPCAEFNFWADPHAARAVLEAGFRLEIVPLDATRATRMTAARRARLAGAGRAGALLARMWGERDEPVHDACVIAALLAPALLAGHERRLAIICEGEQAGRCVEDGSGAPALVHEHIDADAFYELLCERLARLE